MAWEINSIEGKATLSGYTGAKRRVGGITKKNGTLASIRIAVFNRITLEYLGSTNSDAVTGAWLITGLPELPDQMLRVDYFDDLSVYSPVSQDFRTAAV